MPDINDDQFTDADFQMLNALGVPMGRPTGLPGSLSFFESAQLGFQDTWDITKNRWLSITDDPDHSIALNSEEQKAMIGGRPIPTEAKISRAELQRRIDLFDRRDYDQRVPSTLGSLIGALPAMLADPVTVASIPFGIAGGVALKAIPFIRRMTQGATTLRGVLGQSLANEAVFTTSFGLAATPFEIQFAQRAEGEDLTIPQALRRTLGPEAWLLAAVPAGIGTVGALRRLGTQTQADLSRTLRTDPNVIPDSTTVRAAEENPSVQSPPVFAEPREYSPQTRLNEIFTEYPGGVTAFVRDAARGRERARTFGQRDDIRIDVDAGPFRTFLERQAQFTARTTRRSITSNRELLDAIDTPKRTVAQNQNLEELGILRNGRLAPEFAELRVRRPSRKLETARTTFRLNRKSFDVEFANAVDKALFHTQRQNPLRASSERFLKSLGFTADEITDGAKRVRERVRSEAQRRKTTELPIRVGQIVRTPIAVARRNQFLQNGPESFVPRETYRFSQQELIETIEQSRLLGDGPIRNIKTQVSNEQILNDSFNADPELGQILEQSNARGIDLTDSVDVMNRVQQAMASCRAV